MMKKIGLVLIVVFGLCSCVSESEIEIARKFQQLVDRYGVIYSEIGKSYNWDNKTGRAFSHRAVLEIETDTGSIYSNLNIFTGYFMYELFCSIDSSSVDNILSGIEVETIWGENHLKKKYYYSDLDELKKSEAVIESYLLQEGINDFSKLKKICDSDINVDGLHKVYNAIKELDSNATILDIRLIGLGIDEVEHKEKYFDCFVYDVILSNKTECVFYIYKSRKNKLISEIIIGW